MNGSRKFIIISTTIAILLIILVSISLAYAGRDNTLMEDKNLNLKINGFNLELPLSENGAIYDPVCLSSISPNKITLANDPGAMVSINGKTIKTASSINLDLPHLSENDLITIDVKNEKDHRIIYLRCISSELPKLTAVGESPYEGNYYASLEAGKTGLYEISPQGDLVFFMARSQVSPLQETYADFQKHFLDNGSIRYSYQRIFNDGKAAERIILDENHQYLKTIRLTESQNAQENEALKMAAFILINDNHYLVATKQLVLARNIPQAGGLTEAKIKRVLIQEVIDNKLAYEFTSDSFPELYQLNDHNLNSDDDYTGFKGMLRDPRDSNIIAAFNNSLIKIDLKNQSLVWKLSGNQDEFALTEDQKIKNLVSFSLTDELIIFDQGQESGRMVKIKVDEKNKKIINFQELTLENSSAYVDVQKIGDSLAVYLVNWGRGISEIDLKSGKLLLELSLAEENYFSAFKKFMEK